MPEEPTVVLPEVDDHLAVMLRAHAIFIERNTDRADSWTEAGWKGQLVEMRKKLDRLWAIWRTDRTPSPKDKDEALDLINAAVFFIRCAEGDNEDGKWPWP